MSDEKYNLGHIVEALAQIQIRLVMTGKHLNILEEKIDQLTKISSSLELEILTKSQK